MQRKISQIGASSLKVVSISIKETTTMDEPLADGLRVTVEDGTVLVDGAGVALALTAEAAEDLGGQLHAAVIVALGHRAVGPPGS